MCDTLCHIHHTATSGCVCVCVCVGGGVGGGCGTSHIVQRFLIPLWLLPDPFLMWGWDFGPDCVNRPISSCEGGIWVQTMLTDPVPHVKVGSGSRLCYQTRFLMWGCDFGTRLQARLICNQPPVTTILLKPLCSHNMLGGQISQDRSRKAGRN